MKTNFKFVFFIFILFLLRSFTALATSTSLDVSYSLSGGTMYLYLPSDGSYQKALVFVEGFDPAGIYNSSDGSDVWETTAFESILSNAQDTGYAIWIVNFNDGGASTEDNYSTVLEATQVAAVYTGTTVPIAVIGFSMGGVVARYAFAWAEENSVEHYTDLFVSLDAPQQGANVNPFVQAWGMLAAGDFSGYITSPFAQEAISELSDCVLGTTDCSWETNCFGVFGGGDIIFAGINTAITDASMSYGTTSTYHDAFYTSIEALNGGSGYPQDSVNIAVSNGSWSSNSLSGDYLDSTATWFCWPNNITYSYSYPYTDADTEGGSTADFGFTYFNCTKGDCRNADGVAADDYYGMWGLFMMFGNYQLTLTANDAPVYVPTVSAIDYDGSSSSFDDYYVSDTNHPHTEMEEGAIDFILSYLEDLDADSDSVTVEDGDCDDEDSSVNPDASEVCGDGIDNNCDGLSEECDTDSDGFYEPDDNCPEISNPDQLDTDSDSSGDACDADDDGDGLSDEEEASLGTDSLVQDTDGDGMSDGYEAEYGLDPLDNSDATTDLDGDGMTNLDEYTYGFNASDPSELMYKLVPLEYPTIADALSAASSGDVIRIAAGTYYESALSIPSSKTIYLVGSDEDETIIDGSSSGSPIITTSSSSTLILKNLTIQNGYASLGGGVYAEGRLYVDHVIFRQNRASGNGGALYTVNTSYPVIFNSTFEENTADQGGAIYFDLPYQGAVFQSVFSDNSALDGGGAIYLMGPSDVVLLKNTFSDNSASRGGAIYQDEGDLVQFVENYFESNESSGGIGGALYVETAGTDTLLRNVFVDNLAGEAGAFYLYQTGYFEIHNNLFAQNSATGSSGAIESNNSGDHNFFNNNFINNESSDGGAYRGYMSSGTLVNNIFYLSTDRVSAGNDFISLTSASVTCDHSGIHSSDGSVSATELGIHYCSSSSVADPNWSDFSDDGDYEADDFTLSSSSVFINAGNTDSAYDDTDGSVNDLGITGGPYAGTLYQSQEALEAAYASSFGSSYLSGDADGDGVSSSNGDCDDADSSVNPRIVEIYNGIDDDCDGTVDEGTDGDVDGYSGSLFGGDDCDDTNALINPDADELCDGVDNNCDGTIDENDAVDATTWYADSDGDSYGDSSNTVLSCAQPTGYVSDSSDCDDSNVRINPRMKDCAYFVIKRLGLPDVTRAGDGIDNNCDGTADNGRPCVRRLGTM